MQAFLLRKVVVRSVVTLVGSVNLAALWPNSCIINKIVEQFWHELSVNYGFVSLLQIADRYFKCLASSIYAIGPKL
jgi:hypothetical protein